MLLAEDSFSVDNPGNGHQTNASPVARVLRKVLTESGKSIICALPPVQVLALSPHTAVHGAQHDSVSFLREAQPLWYKLGTTSAGYLMLCQHEARRKQIVYIHRFRQVQYPS